MTFKGYALAVVVVVGAVLLNSAVLKNEADQNPYYAPAWCNPMQPAAIIYMGLSHLWLLGRNNNPKALPPSTPDNRNKVAIVTGSNVGIGFETARTLVVDYGWDVVLACRSTKKAVRAMLDINEESRIYGGEAIVLKQPLDLSRFGSVQLFVQEFQERFGKVDVLINNAGRNTSGKSGRLDLLFQSNFLGHFLLTQQLIEVSSLTKEEKSAVINLSSAMHHFSGARPLDEAYWKSVALHSEDRPPETYAASKLAAILFSHELTRRFGIASMAVNPGAVASAIWRDFPEWIQEVMRVFFLTTEQGSRPVVAAALQATSGDGGGGGEGTYLQPYWLPTYNRAPLPFMEMLGPYIGYVVTTPRLPADGGKEAALALWKVSQELTMLPRKTP